MDGLQLTAPLYWEANSQQQSKARLTELFHPLGLVPVYVPRKHFWTLESMLLNCHSMVPRTVFGLASSSSSKQVLRQAWEQRQLEELFSWEAWIRPLCPGGKGVQYHEGSHMLSAGLCTPKQALTWISIRARAPRMATHSFLSRVKRTELCNLLDCRAPSTCCTDMSSTPGNRSSLPRASVLPEEETSASRDSLWLPGKSFTSFGEL